MLRYFNKALPVFNSTLPTRRLLSTMSSPVKDVLLVGFGAVGMIYSLVLERSGQARVTAIARSNYDVIQEKGIHVKSNRYGDIPYWRPHRVCSSLDEALDRPYHYVCVATKVIPEITPTTKLLAPLISRSYSHPQPVYVLMQNGLGIETDLYEEAQRNHPDHIPEILSCALHIGTNLLAPNEVEHNVLDRVEFGLYKHGNFTSEDQTDREKALLAEFGGMLTAGGSDVVIVPEVQRWRFKKNFWNLCFGSIATLSRLPLRDIFQHPDVEATVVPVVREIMLENLAVGRALGFDESAIPISVIDKIIKDTGDFHRRPDSKHKASMLLDSEEGRPMEIEVVVGDIVRKAKRLGVPIPRIETLYAILSITQNHFIIQRTKQ